MNKNFIFIDNKKVLFDKSLTLIQACLRAGVEIPRFCYHDRLSIAGNCRMCLVEIEKSPKPMASCALPILPGMKVFTKSSVVKKAREGILEFLLANHPLDCPICDQGGECDLQDQSLIYGTDRGRFYEKKRAVEDKDCGPLIKTLMTRCIHCTRCIRFSSEIAGISFLGTTGRGLNMEVGSYLDKVFKSELSGNVIDLCPVGALTSKPYSFTARPWDLSTVESIDIFDSLNSNIFFNFKGTEIMRVLPCLNENINEEWISDKIRFSFDGLKIQRIFSPMLKNSKGFINVTWLFITYLLLKILYIKDKSFIKLKGFFGSLIDTESIFAFKKFCFLFENKSFFGPFNYNKINIDFRDFYIFSSLKNLKNCDLVILLGLDFSKESPVLKTKLNSFFLERKPLVFNIGCSFLNFRYNVKNIGNSLKSFMKIIEGRHWICNFFFKFKKIGFVIGNNFLSKENSFFLRNLIQNFYFFYEKIVKRKLNIFYFNFNSTLLQSFELGLINKKFLKKDSFFFDKNFFNLNFILESDENILKYSKSDLSIFQGHHGGKAALKSDIILPGCTFVEKEGIFLNFEGISQKSKEVFSNLEDTRKDWEILLSLVQFSYLYKIGKNVMPVSLKGLREDLYKYSLLLKKKKSYDRNFSFLEKINNFGVLYNVNINSIINNFYLTDSISNYSLNMSSCSKKFNKFNNNFNKTLLL